MPGGSPAPTLVACWGANDAAPGRAWAAAARGARIVTLTVDLGVTHAEWMEEPELDFVELKELGLCRKTRRKVMR